MIDPKKTKSQEFFGEHYNKLNAAAFDSVEINSMINLIDNGYKLEETIANTLDVMRQVIAKQHKAQESLRNLTR